MSVRVKVATYVDEGLRYKWEKAFGRYASISWLLETAMQGMLDAAEHTPSLKEQVEQAILAHVSKYAYHQPEQHDAQQPTPSTA
jgi:hypothetical protein